MKLIRLFLIALLLQPCPVCWEHEFAAVGQCENGESEKSLSAPACCSQCIHSCHAQKQNQTHQHDPQQDCPCRCHVTDVIYAQTAASNNLREFTTPLSTTVDVFSLSVQNTFAKKCEITSSSMRNVVPMRI